MNNEFYTYTAKDIHGNDVSMSDFKDKAVLLVNTASKCGFTPQYEELQQLYTDYMEKGLVILGFPCDQFAHQEPDTDEQIYQFCSRTFGVTFPLFGKIEVNGPNAHPLYQYITEALPGAIGKMVKWNFTKFLIAPDGTPVKRFSPSTNPTKLIPHIERLLSAKKSA